MGVGTISGQHADAPGATTTDQADRAQLPELADRVTIAIESMRTQWRTLADLGTHERMAVSQLRVYGSMPMSELAARISLSRAAVTSLVDRLEADGWVRRVPDEQDRRRTVLRLLPHAAEQFEEVGATYWGELTEWANTLSDDEWRAFRTGLEVMGALAERQADRLRLSAAERLLT